MRSSLSLEVARLNSLRRRRFGAADLTSRDDGREHEERKEEVSEIIRSSGSSLLARKKDSIS